MRFRYSYSYDEGQPDDKLEVWASTNCGLTFQPEDLLFAAKDTSLAVFESRNEWFPTNDDRDWKFETIDLSDYTGSTFDRVRIAFLMSGVGGNNIFVDDVEFFVAEEPPAEIDESFRISP